MIILDLIILSLRGDQHQEAQRDPVALVVDFHQLHQPSMDLLLVHLL